MSRTAERGNRSYGSREPDYATLLAFREALRRFNRWTEEAAKVAGVTPAQHQLMLCIRGHADQRGPTIGMLADSLILRHHSVVELVDRAAVAGLVRRHADGQDARTIRVRLTSKGSRLLRKLSLAHEEEVRRLGALLDPFLDPYLATPVGAAAGVGLRNDHGNIGATRRRVGG